MGTNVRQLSDGNPDGNSLGQSASDKISFYNATPIVQRSGAAQATLPAAGTGATAGAFADAATRDAYVAAIVEMRATLVALGLWKGSA